MDPGENNFLVKEKANKQCILIDFGYTLPESLSLYASKFPFGRDILASPFTSEESKHIHSIHLEETDALLIFHGISEQAVNLHKIALKLLKAAVEREATLNDVVNSIYSKKSTHDGQLYESFSSGSSKAFEFVRYYINPIMLNIVNAKTSEEQDALIKKAF